MGGLKKTAVLCLGLWGFSSLAFSSGVVTATALSVSGKSAYVQALASYREGDWVSAISFLRRAVSDESTSTDDTWFMLINSEMYAQSYRSALEDCNTFLSRFEESPLASYVQYQKGRALHFTGRNDDAVIVLSDFCHQNVGHALYASALYWIAECFFEDYSFDTARSLYERVVSEFPDDEKVGDSQFKLSLISQREREEKLLYLLKMTGEESLSAREEYEKQLRQYQTEDVQTLRRELNTASERIAELEEELSNANRAVSASASPSENAEQTQVSAPSSVADTDGDSADKNRSLAELKEKADLVERLLLQSLINESSSGGAE